MKVGVAINPGTPFSQLECVLDLVDMVLIMTVNPDLVGRVILKADPKKYRNYEK